ncbi:serine protease [Cupriavidus sp. AcVe19-6a]|uniref:trypsin-like serine peptidase n=1 Tax=Cupriavidus sp. AcVe19-6a TaxID=2821358 RepID=UPI001AE41FE9|nr:serine protease [Cupriavidus sp. AcVe19-6a]MBP0640079.1 trypsin-like peptidase domain-containing protein [Cupriavidus sp. AcVe19-6a]
MLDNFTLDQLRSILEARKLEGTLETRVPTRRESHVLKNYTKTLDEPVFGAVARSSSIANVPSSVILTEMRSRQKVVYGEDDRVDVINCADPVRRERARSVAAIVERKNLVAVGEGQVSIGGSTLEQRYALAGKPLCQREAFRTQHCAALGSAFLVAPNVIATAHHCLNEETFAARCLVFDFETGAEGVAPTQFHVDKIYGFKRYLAGDFSPDGSDWALIELDRPVEGRPPLALSSGASAVDLLPLYVIGHPSGLPKKIAGNAEIRVNTASTHFIANLDTYGGNSGSPVFNALTHEVEGILVRGGTDFVPLGDCYASLICPISGCRGEDCSRISPIVEFLAG